MEKILGKTPVCTLQELAQKEKFIIKYELLPFHKKEAQRNIYQYKLTAANVKVYGKGYSKQEAKHNAATNALIQLTDFDLSPIKEPEPPVPPVPNIVGLLNKYVTENDYPAAKFELVASEGEPHTKIFTIECKVGTISLQGSDKTKKKAKYSAAKQMLHTLMKLKPKDSSEMISFHNLISCNNSPPNKDLVREIYNENAFLHKKKKTSHSTLVSSYPETIKLIMNEKDLTFDEIWASYEPEDFELLKNALTKLDINISVKFMQGVNSSVLAFISLDTTPEFTLVEWASSKKEALNAAIKQTIDFLKIMSQ